MITKTNIKSHSMVVTGIDEEGNIIVSSWGKKYKYKGILLSFILHFLDQ